MLQSLFNKRDSSKIFKSSFFNSDVSETVRETVKPDGLILFMKRNCSNPNSVNVAILNLDKRKEKKNWIDFASIC